MHVGSEPPLVHGSLWCIVLGQIHPIAFHQSFARKGGKNSFPAREKITFGNCCCKSAIHLSTLLVIWAGLEACVQRHWVWQKGVFRSVSGKACKKKMNSDGEVEGGPTINLHGSVLAQHGSGHGREKFDHMCFKALGSQWSNQGKDNDCSLQMPHFPHRGSQCWAITEVIQTRRISEDLKIGQPATNAEFCMNKKRTFKQTRARLPNLVVDNVNVQKCRKPRVAGLICPSQKKKCHARSIAIAAISYKTSWLYAMPSRPNLGLMSGTTNP